MLEWGHKSGGVAPILLDGEPVASVDPEFWREGAELVIGDQTREFTRDGSERVARLAGAGQPLLRARRKGFFSSAWLVEGDGVSYEIGPQFLASAHQVRRDGELIGEAPKAGFLSSRACLDVDPSVPPIHQLFLLWLSHIIRRRAASAAAASS
ncbi:hypothetical protein [Ornithinimicrobium murale]|uniref:hypothetical protein n=1 Tax=Ornithinimicrobium murale TaxID=1050153 RepID=UPI0013B457F1|nr:hypothetical protein [Ornithinimicrobium murale]